jgi:kindlin 2
MIYNNFFFLYVTEITMDWSEHALWWPLRNRWLLRTRSTLDQCGVGADALLHFTPMRKRLRVQLPDLRYLDATVDFSVKTFNAVVHLCRELGIRHPEELSFCKPLEPNHLKYNLKDLPRKRHGHENGNSHAPADTNTFIAGTETAHSSNSSLDKSNSAPFLCAPVSPPRNNHHHNANTPISSPLTVSICRIALNFLIYNIRRRL